MSGDGQKNISRAMDLRRSYKIVFSTPEGQRVLGHLVKTYMAGRPPGTNDEYVGSLRVVQAIVRYVNLREDQLRMMLEKTYTEDT